MRSLLYLILLTVCSLPVASQEQHERFEGRTVASVIEDFRSQGWSFAYSTNLVSDELIVLIEPQGDNVLDIVRQILEPHGLTIRSEEGLWLIVRSDSAAARMGSLLIIVSKAVFRHTGLLSTPPAQLGMCSFIDSSALLSRFGHQSS